MKDEEKFEVTIVDNLGNITKEKFFLIESVNDLVNVVLEIPFVKTVTIERIDDNA